LLDPGSLLGSDSSQVQIGPDLPPPAAEPPPQAQAPNEPVLDPGAPRRVRKPLPVPPANPVTPPPATPPPSNFETDYRTLPNGTIVKIR